MHLAVDRASLTFDRFQVAVLIPLALKSCNSHGLPQIRDPSLCLSIRYDAFSVGRVKAIIHF